MLDRLVNNALVKFIPYSLDMLVQLINIIDLHLVHLLLKYWPEFIINRIQIRTVRRPECWREENWCFSLLCTRSHLAVLLWYRLAFRYLSQLICKDVANFGTRCIMSGKKSCQGKLFIIDFIFGRLLWFLFHYLNLFCYLLDHFSAVSPSVLWCCWLGSRKGIRPVKNWVVGCWRGYLSGVRCWLHMAQLMPLPLTISCSSKSRLVLPEWFCFSGPAYPVCPGKGR